MGVALRSGRDDFEWWLVDMDDALDRFIGMVGGLPQGPLDYSIESLDAIERWLLGRYPAKAAALAPSEASVVDGAARYVGETFRRVLGGHWDIELADAKNAYYGLPILRDVGSERDEECPLTLVTAAIDRRKGDYLRTVLQAYLA